LLDSGIWRRTAIITFIFFFWVPLPAATQTNANVPPACSNVIAHYRAKSALLNAEIASKFGQTFGRSVADAVEPTTPNECPRALQFCRWKLQKAKALLPSWKAMYAECTSVGINITARPAAGFRTTGTPPQLVAVLQQKIAEGCH
jgi:hypothetical protein